MGLNVYLITFFRHTEAWWTAPKAGHLLALASTVQQKVNCFTYWGLSSTADSL